MWHPQFPEMKAEVVVVTLVKVRIRFIELFPSSFFMQTAEQRHFNANEAHTEMRHFCLKR